MAESGSLVGVGPLKFRRLGPEMQEAVTSFYSLVGQGQDLKFFHPQPMNRVQAERLCNYSGLDSYYVACAGTRILAYGMLRGWDEGYTIPSLGIVVHPDARGMGVAKAFISFLHLAAKVRGANKVRLTVYAENVGAVELYRRLGYTLEPKNEQEYVGTIVL